MKERIAATTLGCKVNQVETCSLLEAFKAQGYEVVPFKEKADIYLINTCAVTARAAYESRQLLRRALKNSPKLVIATGCYVQIGLEEIIEKIDHPLFLVGQDQKAEIPNLIKKIELPLERNEIYVKPEVQLRQCIPFFFRRFYNHHRAFVKIQDGCNAFCSYCVVPYARGRARSLPEDLVLQQIRLLKQEGYGEIVLTGIHLGWWGKDLSPPRNLLSLLKAVSKLHPPRIRLSSLNPEEISPALLDFAAESRLICPHFHLSLQSLDNQVLKLMNRHYGLQEIEEVVWMIKERFPNAALGADIIAGFPGETEEAFGRTLEALRRLPVDYLHVFPYSPRPGTKAAAMPQLPPHLVAQRAKALRELARAKKKAFYHTQMGRSFEVLVQGYDDRQNLYRGLTENYLTLYFSGPPGLEGQIVRVKGERLVDECLYGRLENRSSLNLASFTR